MNQVSCGDKSSSAWYVKIAVGMAAMPPRSTVAP
jgi:hypothetical protein